MLELQSRAAVLIGYLVPIQRRRHMSGLIYLVGLIVVIMAILSLLGLR